MFPFYGEEKVIDNNIWGNIFVLFLIMEIVLKVKDNVDCKFISYQDEFCNSF